MRNTSKRVAKPRNTVRFRPMLEILEGRYLLDAQPITTLLLQPVTNSSTPALAAPEVSPAATVSITVSGTAKWTDPSGGTHAIPLAYVEIRSSTEKDSDPALATCQTNLSGQFTATVNNFDTSSGAGVFARIYAKNPAANVMGTAAGATTYFMDTQKSAPVTSSGNIALPERDASNAAANPAEESFGILGALLQAQTYASLLGGGGPTSAPARLVVRFAIPNTSTTNYDSGTGQMFVEQVDYSNWDVLEHEYGHYVAFTNNFLSIAPGLPHGFGVTIPKPNGPPDAWDEGWADFFSISAQLNEPSVYANGVPGEGDTSFTDNSVGVNYNLATGTGLGELDEASVSSTLYHLSEAIR